MKVIICGAGQVGYHIARYLSDENNDVTVIDKQAALVQKISDSLDVQGIIGYASHPDVLQRAGAEDAEMLIAVTYADEVNMVACQVAHSIFHVPTRIARIRAQEYLRPIWQDLFSRDNLPIDAYISPEIEVARAIIRRLEVPGAFDSITLADGKVMLIGVLCDPNCPLVDTPLRQLDTLFPDLSMRIVAIIRGDQRIIPSRDEQVLIGDEVYFVCDADHLTRAMSAFGHEEPEARRILIQGGGNIGLFVAQQIEEHFPEVGIHLIEQSRSRAESIAQQLQRTVVLHGNALDNEVLEEANVALTETVVSVTDDDEGNILGSLLAKRYGCDRAITLINKTSYNPLLSPLGIDAVVSPRAITVSTILQHIRRGRIRSVHTLRDGFAEIIEAEAIESSRLCNKSIEELGLPSGVIIGAVVRNDSVFVPNDETVIRPQDRVIILATHDQVRDVERAFAVGLEFF